MSGLTVMRSSLQNLVSVSVDPIHSKIIPYEQVISLIV